MTSRNIRTHGPMRPHATNPIRHAYTRCPWSIEVHRQLGPGLLESAYDECLAIEMHERGLRFEWQARVPLIYKNHSTKCDFHPDFIVGGEVILEVKSVQTLLSVHKAQVRTYLKLGGINTGLLVNFNVACLMPDGVRRLAVSPRD